MTESSAIATQSLKGEEVKVTRLSKPNSTNELAVQCPRWGILCPAAFASRMVRHPFAHDSVPGEVKCSTAATNSLLSTGFEMNLVFPVKSSLATSGER
jgi:hypothetical protein